MPRRINIKLILPVAVIVMIVLIGISIAVYLIYRQSRDNQTEYIFSSREFCSLNEYLDAQNIYYKPENSDYDPRNIVKIGGLENTANQVWTMKSQPENDGRFGLWFSEYTPGTNYASTIQLCDMDQTIEVRYQSIDTVISDSDDLQYQLDTSNLYDSTPQLGTNRETLFYNLDHDLQLISSRDPETTLSYYTEITQNGDEVYRLESTGEDMQPITAHSFLTFSASENQNILVVVENTLGAHCCSTYHILLLSAEGVSEINTFQPSDYWISFKDLNNDSYPEVLVPDWSIVKDRSCSVCYVAPALTYEFNKSDNKFVYEPSLMRKDSPTEDEYRLRVNFVKTSFVEFISEDQSTEYFSDSYLYYEIKRDVYELIYSGNSELAWKYLDDVWQLDPSLKESTKSHWEDELTGGDYWERISEENNG